MQVMDFKVPLVSSKFVVLKITALLSNHRLLWSQTMFRCLVGNLRREALSRCFVPTKKINRRSGSRLKICQ